MIKISQKNNQRIADNMTLFSLLVLLIGGIITKSILGMSGMEALGAIIPIFVIVIIHLFCGTIATINAFRTRNFVRNIHVYGYFVVFMFASIVLLGVVNGIDIEIKNKFYKKKHPQEAELYQLLTKLSHTGKYYSKPIDKVAKVNALNLIENNTDLLYKPLAEQYRRTPHMLVLAVESGDTDLVKAILDHGVSVDIIYPSDREPRYSTNQPLYIATEQGLSSIVSLLIDHGADPNDSIYKQRLLLRKAVKKKDYPTAKALLKGHAKVNYTFPDMSSPIYSAISNNDPTILKLLLDYGGNPNMVNLPGRKYSTPIIAAIENKCTQCVQLLINAGAKIKGSNHKGQSIETIIKEQGLSEINVLLKKAKNEN